MLDASLSLRRPTLWALALTAGLAAGLSHPAHGKLPPPSPAEQAAAAAELPLTEDADLEARIERGAAPQ